MSTAQKSAGFPLSWAALLIVCLTPARVLGQPEAPGLEPGLILHFQEPPSAAEPLGSRCGVLPRLWVPEGSWAFPEAKVAELWAIWEGFLSAELRSFYTLHAEFNGVLRLELNGKTVLDTNSSGGALLPAERIRLSKGTNSFRAEYEGPSEGDAHVRIYWAERTGLPFPIPFTAMSHSSNSVPSAARTRQKGRDLFFEYRCIRCHTKPANSADAVELAMDSPVLDEIGTRRNAAWMARWIADPRSARATARMPRLFRPEEATEQARAIAAYFESLSPVAAEVKTASADAGEAGKRLFEKLHCTACHDAPESPPSGIGRISLARVREKFRPGILLQFLREPERHYAWIRMPNFRLTESEAGELAAYLEGAAQSPATQAARPDLAAAGRGRELVQTAGCLNCHSAQLENRYVVPLLRELRPDRLGAGCLAESLEARGRAPDFSLVDEERAALREFLGGDVETGLRHAPAEFAERQAVHLNCRECHGKIEGAPAFELLGWKLRPEWSARVLSGQLESKPRPWIEARMPGFPSWAEPMARGLSESQGGKPQDDVAAAAAVERFKQGVALVSSVGGFSCVACHSIGAYSASQVFETAGINFARVHERLRREYFDVWVLNPIKIEPGSKMPVYFDEQGRSPLTEILDGDGLKQIGAIWDYMRLGDKMPPP